MHYIPRRKAIRHPRAQKKTTISTHWVSALIAICGTAGLSVLMYPTAASWMTSYNQSQILEDYAQSIDAVDPDAETQLELARKYNEALVAGVDVEALSNKPSGSGTLLEETLNYHEILTSDKSGLMSRIKVPSIGLDLPIFHGTSDEVLLAGAGHLEGSHLPIGGESTHSVITAHRGLANATMFTNLDRVKIGDTFTVEVFGEVLTYSVKETKVVLPEDTETLRAREAEDLMTLITCTPLGINSHRILVTGERITPTPQADLSQLGQPSGVPGFPWWSVIYVGGLAALTMYTAHGVRNTRRANLNCRENVI